MVAAAAGRLPDAAATGWFNKLLMAGFYLMISADEM